ncbi:gamma-glutamyltransferase [Pseudohalioglobus sediminis]|uniref:Glutathione hydrolase proenzyme n=1 Tax=Pseudohalioglobus sediminis TaxID=2606449 RepID=A0A5B0WS08_9GAMM|nr:gamma-glutamyltransferase [Pseudohalioglobus sediminis]KAA1189794.1 gamma-glutamyltransferase [Pseudohalioglobus sediminis]
MRLLCKILGLAALLSLLQACAATETQQEEVSDVSAELGAGGRPVGAKWSRSPVYGSRGMAATAHPLASQVALDILKEGGSAVDAAIAANAALGLMEPTGNGIGGDIFVIVWDPKSKQLYGYNGSGRSPMGQSLAELQSRIDAMKARGELPQDHEGIPSHGPLSVSVPGTVDGWFAIHERFGRLPMNQVLAPTIDYAREGFPVTPVIAYYLDRSWAFFSEKYADSPHLDNIRDTWFKGGSVPEAGDIFANPDLAATLEAIALDGRDAFYRGDLARSMADYFAPMEGGLAYRDFAEHRGEWVSPRSVRYRGYDLYELPPNGQGFAALQMLSILKNVDLAQWSRGSAEVFHYMVEAKRLAFEDMARFYADPDFADIPVDGLLADDYGKQRFALIDPSQVTADVGPGEPKLEGEGDTTYLTVADENGMMVSLIQSNYRGMGSGMVPDGLGFMLQDRGELFSLEPGHANVYEPGKRPFHTIIPAFLMKDGEPVMSFGLMGGGMQPQGHVQILVNMLDFGMNVQEAGDAARFMHDGGRQPTGIDKDPLGVLYLEPGVSADTVERLRAMGHKVEIDDSGVRFGGYQAIRLDREKGSYAGATEMRKDGTVAAW